MMKSPLRILIVAALCIAGLIGLVVRETMARNEGAEILLTMESVDPRALLQGHYVIIDLRERLEVGESCPPTNAGAETTGWVALASDGETYHAVAGAGLREDAAREGALLVRGGLSCEAPTEAAPDMPGMPGWVQLNIGIDRFYVDQTRAEQIDHMLRSQNAGGEPNRVLAIVSVGRDGRARLRGLLVDRERIELGWT